MAQPLEQAQPQPQKAFPVSWDQFHRDARALAWRLAGAGPFQAIVCVTRGGLVPAAIVARELGIRLIETVCVSSYNHITQGEVNVLKDVARSIVGIGGGRGKGVRPSTPSPWADPWSTRSLPKYRKTPGSIFPGTPALPSSRRSGTVDCRGALGAVDLKFLSLWLGARLGTSNPKPP